MDEQKLTSPNDDRKDPKRQEQRQRQIHFSVGYLLTALLVMWVFQEFILAPLAARATEIGYSDFKHKVASGQVVQVVVGRDRIQGTLKSATPGAAPGATVPFTTFFEPEADPKLADDLDRAGVNYAFARPSSPIGALLLSWILPTALLFALYSFAARRLGAGAGGAAGIFGVGKSKATVVTPAQVGVTFKDVGGADEAIAELQEIIQFLREPERFTTLGGRIPKGVLLVGPPGTGKTLLAKATAGEAQVAFFETSGSEFVEMFVGVGAARVRDLFEQARKAAPAIVFIDEIDAIGESRGGTVRIGNNDEREQTLNQLLSEIDGFKTDPTKPVILMAATNRPEILDPALLRAGRFDRQIAVGNPDLIGRTEILRIHTRKVRLAADFDIGRAAQMTPGFSGADLANVVNEAALLAARRQAEAITLDDFQMAIERVVAGLEKRTRVMNARERNTVAHHEAGHALVAALVPHGDPVSKISIVPHTRGALGYTLQLPTEDRFLLTTDELEDRIAVMMGGRAAEKVVFDSISTGASDDIQHATELCRRMVTEYGMSDKLGAVRYAGPEFQYLGGSAPDGSAISPRTHEIIDAEVQRMVAAQYERARELLAGRRAALEALAGQLLKEESVDGSAVQRALKENPTAGEAGKTPQSSVPPVESINAVK